MWIAIAIVLAAVAAAVLAQLLLPRIAARRIERRLSGSGGVAAVTVAAVPALLLLGARGDRLVVRGSGLTIGLGKASEGTAGGLRALDGFTDVDVELTDLRAGPFAIAALALVRRASGPFAMAAEGSVTGAELARSGESWLRSAIPGGPLIGAAARNLPLGARSVPVAFEIELHSEEEGLRVGSGGGTIAGYPAGPIATTIAAAVARRLEIAP
jgi:hypothetical protein